MDIQTTLIDYVIVWYNCIYSDGHDDDGYYEEEEEEMDDNHLSSKEALNIQQSSGRSWSKVVPGEPTRSSKWWIDMISSAINYMMNEEASLTAIIGRSWIDDHTGKQGLNKAWTWESKNCWWLTMDHWWPWFSSKKFSLPLPAPLPRCRGKRPSAAMAAARFAPKLRLERSAESLMARWDVQMIAGSGENVRVDHHGRSTNP